MNTKALYNLSYGVFMLSSEYEGVTNGCITNTCMQIANDPTRIAISVINSNYTCDIIKKRGEFVLSILDERVSFDVIKHFGMQSGRNVDKFAGTNPKRIDNMPYLNCVACAYLKGKVTDKIDLGSHTLFIAELVDAEVLSDKKPITYADYQSHIKPKAEKIDTTRTIKAWRCKICGYVYEGSDLPKEFLCPVCGHPSSDFEPIYQ